jgi:hypothetical protein
MKVSKIIPFKSIQEGDTIRAEWAIKGLKQTTEGTVEGFTSYGTPINEEQRLIGPSVTDNHFVTYILLNRPEKDILEGRNKGDKLEYRSIISGYTYVYTKLSDNQWLQETYFGSEGVNESSFDIVTSDRVRKSHGVFKPVRNAKASLLWKPGIQ